MVDLEFGEVLGLTTLLRLLSKLLAEEAFFMLSSLPPSCHRGATVFQTDGAPGSSQKEHHTRGHPPLLGPLPHPSRGFVSCRSVQQLQETFPCLYTKDGVAGLY